MGTRRNRTGFGIAVFAMLTVFALCATPACAEPSTRASAKPGMNAAAAAEVPAAIRTKGTLVVAADATYAPNEFIGPDGHTVVGMDADLAQAIGSVLGLKMDVVNANFAGIIPGLASGKYNLGMSSFTDTLARQKVVDFVTYFSAGTSFFVKAQGGPDIKSLADLCGHTVAVETGTTEQSDAHTQAAACIRPASRVSVCSPTPTRTVPTSRSPAAAPRSAWPTRRSRPTR